MTDEMEQKILEILKREKDSAIHGNLYYANYAAECGKSGKIIEAIIAERNAHGSWFFAYNIEKVIVEIKELIAARQKARDIAQDKLVQSIIT